MNYTVYDFYTRDEIERSLLIALLNDNYFDGFEETSETLQAYVPDEQANDQTIMEILTLNDWSHIRFEKRKLEHKNWNEEWEKNFSPVLLAERVGIRAPFHEPLVAEFELVIEPKMSFGTGHHPTTEGMVKLMLSEKFEGKSVLDFGSGTGVLAILAEKLGATEILAVDNEEWAYENAKENAERNNCKNIICQLANDSFTIKAKYDVVLANINRHVILAQIQDWAKLLKQGGLMMVSGILDNDEKVIVEAAQHCGLNVKNILRLNGWLAISFSHI